MSSDSSPSTDQRYARPGSATAVAILVVFAAILQFLAAGLAIFLAVRPGEQQQLFGTAVSDWYWLLTAVLSIFLGGIYIWLAGGILSARTEAWALVNILAAISVIFSLFQIPFGTGWVALLVGVLILVLNNTNASRAYFRADDQAL